MQQIELSTTSVLDATPETVWGRIATIEGISHELGPWMRITAPRGTELSVEAAPLGRRWFRSCILPRTAPACAIHPALIAALFRHRHRRLRAHLAGS